MNKVQQSVLDYLIDSLDQLQHLRKSNPSAIVTGKAAATLFDVWKNHNNRVSSRVFKRPPTVSLEDVKAMQKEGLVRDLGDKLEVTDKGSTVIRVMILGDDRSVFEPNAPEITYAEAEANTKERSLKTSRKRQEHNWWSQALQ